jgi:hypothetical protein
VDVTLAGALVDERISLHDGTDLRTSGTSFWPMWPVAAVTKMVYAGVDSPNVLTKEKRG